MLELLLAGRPYDPPVAEMNYDQFVTWLETHGDQYTSMNASVTDTSPGSSYVNRYVRIKLTQTTIVMWGTSYKDWFTHDSRWAPITRHACPSDAIFQYMLSNQQYCLLKFSETAIRSLYTGITRNGFTSFTMSSDYLGMHLLDFIYYDYTVDKVMRYNPFIDNPPVPFTGDLL